MSPRSSNDSWVASRATKSRTAPLSNVSAPSTSPEARLRRTASSTSAGTGIESGCETATASGHASPGLPSRPRSAARIASTRARTPPLRAVPRALSLIFSAMDTLMGPKMWSSKVATSGGAPYARQIPARAAEEEGPGLELLSGGQRDLRLALLFQLVLLDGERAQPRAWLLAGERI